MLLDTKVLIAAMLANEEVVEEIRESLFSSSADDDDISYVDLLLMDWMDFSSRWMMPPPLLVLELEVFCFLLR